MDSKSFLKDLKKVFVSDQLGYQLDEYLSTDKKLIVYKPYNEKLMITLMFYVDTPTWVGVTIAISDIVPMIIHSYGQGLSENWLVYQQSAYELAKSKVDDINEVWLRLENENSFESAFEKLQKLLTLALLDITEKQIIEMYLNDEKRIQKLEYLKNIAHDFIVDNHQKELTIVTYLEHLKSTYGDSVKKDYIKSIANVQELASLWGSPELFGKGYEKALKSGVETKNKFALYFAFRSAIPTGNEIIDNELFSIAYSPIANDIAQVFYSTFQTFIEKQYEGLL